nr:hypothetical protein Iba_chr11eCG11140 [Ipomoea batatas]
MPWPLHSFTTSNIRPQRHAPCLIHPSGIDAQEVNYSKPSSPPPLRVRSIQWTSVAKGATKHTTKDASTSDAPESSKVPTKEKKKRKIPEKKNVKLSKRPSKKTNKAPLSPPRGEEVKHKDQSTSVPVVVSMLRRRIMPILMTMVLFLLIKKLLYPCHNCLYLPLKKMLR